jgi:hypothetical protein
MTEWHIDALFVYFVCSEYVLDANQLFVGGLLIQFVEMEENSFRIAEYRSAVELNLEPDSSWFTRKLN